MGSTQPEETHTRAKHVHLTKKEETIARLYLLEESTARRVSGLCSVPALMLFGA